MSSDADVTAVAAQCSCGCLGVFCPCGSPCESCFPPPPDPLDYDGGSAELSVEAAMNFGLHAAPPAEPELHWQEALFRRQYDALPIDAQLQHLYPFLPRLVEMYAAYYFLRTRGYVLHPGLKLGMDYAVYPAGGAPRWHAQFAVLVGPLEVASDSIATPVTTTSTAATDASAQPSDADEQDIHAAFQQADPQAAIDHIMRCMRISFNQKKSCLYVRVFCAAAPISAGSDSASAEPNSPFSLLSRCSVRVTLLREWFVSKGRGMAASGAPQQKQAVQQIKMARKLENKQRHQQQLQQQQQQKQGQHPSPASTEQPQSKKQKTEPAVAAAAQPADIPAS